MWTSNQRQAKGEKKSKKFDKDPEINMFCVFFIASEKTKQKYSFFV
jgi:hypothetical protein